MSLSSTEKREVRKFGVIALVFFGSLGALSLWKAKPILIYLCGFLSILGIGFFLLPDPLKPVYYTWLRIARLMGRTVTALILTLAYFLVITPSAHIKKLISGCPLPVRPDRKRTSYWVIRQEPAQPKERFTKRF